MSKIDVAVLQYMAITAIVHRPTITDTRRHDAANGLKETEGEGNTGSGNVSRLK